MYKKVIVVCDQAEMKKLKGKSVLAESIRQFDIDVLCIEIDDATRKQILSAQEQQKMTNAFSHI